MACYSLRWLIGDNLDSVNAPLLDLCQNESLNSDDEKKLMEIK